MFTSVQMFADWLIYNVFGIAKDSSLGSALNFFVFDSIKIFILLLTWIRQVKQKIIDIASFYVLKK